MRLTVYFKDFFSSEKAAYNFMSQKSIKENVEYLTAICDNGVYVMSNAYNFSSSGSVVLKLNYINGRPYIGSQRVLALIHTHQDDESLSNEDRQVSRYFNTPIILINTSKSVAASVYIKSQDGHAPIGNITKHTKSELLNGSFSIQKTLAPLYNQMNK